MTLPTTWNPSDKGSGLSLFNGNLTAAGSGSVYRAVRATLARSTGKYCWQNTQTGVTANSSAGGFATSAMGLNNYVGASAVSVAFQPNNHTLKSSEFTLGTAPNVTFTIGDVMTFCVDLDAGKMWLAKNGVWTSGNPVTGVAPWVTFTAPLTLFPAYSSPDASNNATANFGATAFAYALPSGFEVWDDTPTPPPDQGGNNNCIGANVGSGSTASVSPPGGRLTAESCTPIMLLDHPVITKIYYTRYVHSRAPISDGLVCRDTAIPQLVIELDPALHEEGNLYDLFLFPVEGVPKLGSSPAWPSNTALPPWANGLTDGIETNATAITLYCDGQAESAAIGTATFVGTFYATADGQTSFESQPVPVLKGPGLNGYVLGIWNAYNREVVHAMASDGAEYWTYADFPARFANDNPNNRIWWVDGRGLSQPYSRYDTTITYSGQQPTGASAATALDWQPGDMGRLYGSALSQSAFIDYQTGTPLPSMAIARPQIGLHNFAAIEYATAVVIRFEGTQFIDPNNGQPFNPPGSRLSFSTLSLQVEM